MFSGIDFTHGKRAEGTLLVVLVERALATVCDAYDAVGSYQWKVIAIAWRGRE